MLVQRCTLDQHRLIIRVSITKPIFPSGNISNSFSQQNYRALIDTGAQRSVITRSVISEQNLMRTGHMQFASLHGPQTHSRYLADIAIWTKRVGENATASQYEKAELTLYKMPEAFEIADMQNNENFDMILGFDVLKYFSFRFDASHSIFEMIVSD